jgi:nucleotide-binding universal stress UspA family protein
MISVLLNVNADLGHKARLQAAITLVKSQGGHITCVQVVSVMPVAADSSSAMTEVQAMVALEQAAKEFQETVEAALEKSGVSWSWHRMYGDPATILIERARLADVIVLSANDSVPPISTVALHTRAGILAVPQDPVFEPEKPALVAWNGSEPAANAVRAAVPLLHSMEPVHVLAVDHDSNEFPASLAQDYLEHHAIRSELHWRSTEDRKENSDDVAEAIIDNSEELGSGLIIAGAFGHNRLREMLLGSVTRSLLRNSPRPLLLAH